MSGNRTYPCVHHYTADTVSLAYISFPIGVLVLTQNLLCIITIRRTPKLHTNANIVMSSIACGDIYVSLVDVAHGIFYLPGFTDSLWNNAILDACIFGAGYSSLLLSVIQMGLIAVDRYIHIAHPLYYMAHVTRSRVYTMIAFCWIVALVYCLIPIFVYTDRYKNSRCLVISPTIEYLALPRVVYHVVLILICVCYFRIAHLAFQRKKASQARQMRLGGRPNRETFSTSRTAVWRSVKFFASMCGIFFVSTYPGFVADVINDIQEIPMYVYMSLMFLFLIHSTCNLFVYISMSNDFRQGIKKIFIDVHHMCLKTVSRRET